MYEILTDEQADQQIAALPADALALFAQVRALLESHPWNGDPIHRDNPTRAIRTLPFGPAGMISYSILEGDRCVDLLGVLWAR